MPDDTSLIAHAETVSPNREAFPCLTGAQVAQIAEVAQRRIFKDGEVLWGLGDQNASFYVILDGAVDIFQTSARGGDRSIVRHGPSGFTGDVDLLSSKAAVVAARAVGETETLELCPDRLRKLVVADSGLSDVVLGAFLARRQALIASGFGSIMILGSRFSPDTFRIREFLERNSRPFEWLDLDAEDNVAALLEGFGVSVEETPVLVGPDGAVYRNPSIEEMAECMGLSRVNDQQIYDAIVVGAGPAGLASAVYAASEGLDVVVVDAIAPGGQASTSSKIENYLGFPTGISGRELAQRAFVQAEKFGARLATPRRGLKLDCSQKPYAVDIGDGQSIRARTVVIATGAQYRRLPIVGCEQFEGRGIYFGATAMEARLCAGQEAVIVGGGNSAGQAAVYLSQHAEHVHIYIRSESLERTMSKYLIQRIDASPKITLHCHTEITGLHGAEALEAIDVLHNQTKETRGEAIRHVFTFIGAAPNTDWLNGCVALDAKGFVRTGRDLAPNELNPLEWAKGRPPFLLETNRPGVFAAGDVRAGSTKRVASAVGEGSIAVSFIHQALAE